MRIACLQFAPQVGDVENNLNRADAVLSRANVDNIDLLVLPELAFTGYNFRSLQHISPYLEPTTAGITSLWARTTALKHNCFVVAGYPEKVDVSPKWPTSPEYYNSAIIVNRDGETIANYRKSFLYITDETWALEGPEGFFGGQVGELGNVAMGICMDLNPYKFEAPWTAWEFAKHVVHREPNLVILSMAWLTREDAQAYSCAPLEPDMETLSYWLARMEPVIRKEGEDEIIVVFANRSGSEDEAVYAGSSAILGIQAGEVKVYGILGRGERELLVVDTSKRPQMMLVSEPKQRREQVGWRERERSSTRRYAEARVSPSSNSSFDSQRSLSSRLSLDTGNTSAEPATLIPAIGSVALTEASPVDHPYPQAYYQRFAEAKTRDIPSSTDKLRKPTPTPEVKHRKPTPTIDVQRGTHRSEYRRGITPSPEYHRRATPSPDKKPRDPTPSPEYQQIKPRSSSKKPRKPTPNPDLRRGQTPSPEMQHAAGSSDETRRKVAPTPVYNRPASPKSRNTSRNRSRVDDGNGEEPLILDNATWEQFTPPMVKDEEEIARILQEINDDDEIIAIESDSDIIEIIDEKELRAGRETGSKAPTPEMVEERMMSRMSSRQGRSEGAQANVVKQKERRVESTRPTRADTVPYNTASTDSPEEWQSSFTKNPFGPRSRHISPRPRSTIF